MVHQWLRPRASSSPSKEGWEEGRERRRVLIERLKKALDNLMHQARSWIPRISIPAGIPRAPTGEGTTNTGAKHGQPPSCSTHNLNQGKAEQNQSAQMYPVSAQSCPGTAFNRENPTLSNSEGAGGSRLLNWQLLTRQIAGLGCELGIIKAEITRWVPSEIKAGCCRRRAAPRLLSELQLQRAKSPGRSLGSLLAINDAANT